MQKINADQNKETYYDLLKIDQNADQSTIKKAYFAMAKLYHPDKSSEEDKEKNRAIYDRVQRAYHTLTDDKKREKYNEMIKFGQTEFSDEEARRHEAEEEAKREWEEKRKLFEQEAAEKIQKQRENKENLEWWYSAASLGFFSFLAAWGVAQGIASYRGRVKEKQEQVQKREENIIKLKTKQQMLEEKREKKRQQTAQMIKEEQEKRRLLEEQMQNGEEPEEFFQEIVFDIDDSQVPDMEESKESLENYNEILKEQMEEAKKEKDEVKLYCLACKKLFKSPNSWDNHLNSNKHKKGFRALKGQQLKKYNKNLEEINLFIAQSYAQSESEDSQEELDERELELLAELNS